MKTSQFSWQSYLFGLASAVALFGVYGAAHLQTPGAGRYQAVASENRLMILDTMTGKAWTKFVSSGSGTTSSGFEDAKR